MKQFEYARPLFAFPPDISEVLGTAGPDGLDDRQDEIFTNVVGMAPGWPEAFATKGARDAALGPYGPYVSFVATTFEEVKNAGFAISHVAIGHQLSDPDFGKVAPAVLDAFVADMAETGHGAVIIGRVRYDIRRFRGDVAVGAVPEFAVCVDPAVIDTTMRWLHDNYAPLLRRQVTARA